MLGIALMLGFCILAPMGDALAKRLGQDLPIGFLVLVRFGMQAAIFGVLALVLRARLPLRGRMLRLTILRTLFHIGGLSCMFLALQFLPLADAVAIAFVMPFIMLLLGRFVLGEEVGPHRLGACAVGFLGTLLVVQPNFLSVGAPALLPMAVAVFFSLFMLVTRAMAKDVDAVGLQAASGLIATPLIGAGMLLWPDSTIFAAPEIAPVHWRLLLWMGALGALAHLMMTWSLRYAPSATLAPMQYLEIPVSVFLGWWAFSQLPNQTASLGIAITVAAGLYVIARERRIATRPVPPPAPPAA